MIEEEVKNDEVHTPVAQTEQVEAPAVPEKEVKSEETRTKPGKKAAEPERQDMTTLHERTIAAMSYFGFLAIVPFYLKKDSEFCRFHGKQGMLLAIIFFIAKLLTVLDLLNDLTLILQIVIMFWMGLAALSGRWKKMPFFYDWSCQLEDALTLKTKEEEIEEVTLKPNEIKDNPKQAESK